MQPQPADDAIVGGNPEVTDVEIFNKLTNTGMIDITTGTLQPQGDVDNTGTINVGDGSSIVSSFNLGSSTTLSGSGEVVLKNSDNLPGSNATLIGGSTPAVAVTNAAGHTIRGEGSLSLGWINNGLVQADETSGNSSGVLRITNSTFINNGDLRSSSGASIALTSVTYSQGIGGKLFADTDNITLSATSISGGSLETVGGGSFELVDGNNAVTLAGVTINAPINIIHTVGSGVLRSNSAGVTNNSSITLDGQGSGVAQFGFNSPGTLDGAGEIILVGGNANTLIGVFPGFPAEFTHGADHTIRGSGVIGSPIINQGTIQAEVQNGNILTINASQTNQGLMEAASGATLRFQANTSNTTQSASGVISAADGGRVELDSQSITGGTLQTLGSGVIAVDTNAPTLSDLTIAAGSAVNVSAGRTLRVAGSSITNNGTVTLNSNALVSTSTLQVDSNLNLGGTGQVVLNEQNSNFPAVIRPNGNTITQAAGHTVSGAGQLLGSGKFVNNGRIEGTSPAEPVRIRTRLEGTGVLENVLIDRGTFDIGVHAPGNGVGTVPLEGSYTINGNNQARLEIEIGGLSAGTEHDLLDSTGTVALGGVLDVSAVDLGNAYVPTAGDRFTIIQSTSAITGTFFNSIFPSLGFGRTLTWKPVDYSDPLKVVLELNSVKFFDADFNEDGKVDGEDLTNWQAGYGTGNTHMQGDADDDGDVDGRDFLRWQRQLGLGVSSLAVSSVVPEPTSRVVLFFCLMLFFSSPRRDCASFSCKECPHITKSFGRLFRANCSLTSGGLYL
ncbi:hypothetical protein [Bythopirellula polymerisocia]|nr:hypothetical protein [Bythopirellula polymerisocia]